MFSGPSRPIRLGQVRRSKVVLFNKVSYTVTTGMTKLLLQVIRSTVMAMALASAMERAEKETYAMAIELTLAPASIDS